MTTENDTNFWNMVFGSFLTILGGIQLWVIKVFAKLPFNYTLKEDHKDDINEIKAIITDGVKSMKEDNDTLHARINKIIEK